MQDRHSPPSPPDVRDLDSDNEMILDGDVEEIFDSDDWVFENASSSEGENENSPMENQMERDDAVCVFRGHASSKKTASISTRG